MLELYSVPLAGGTVTKLNGTLVADGDVSTTTYLISPDSQRVVYRADPVTDTVIELFSVPLGGGTVTQLNPPLVADGNVVDFFLISPDSQRVVYSGDQDADEKFELFSVPLGGGIVTQISAPLPADGDVSGDFLISPDSQRVVYRADPVTDDMFELFSVPLAGGAVTQLNSPLVAGGDVSGDFLISPDSQRVVYRADQVTDNVFELYSVPLAGGAVTQLNGPLVAGGSVIKTSPDISPDSQRVVYGADQDTDAVFELYSVPLAGGAVTKLNGPLVADGNAFIYDISPDSQRVVYRADQETDEEVELYSVPLAGGAVTKLNGPLVADGDVVSFRIGPASGRVVYVADELTDGVFELFSVILQAELKALFESPVANAVAAGVALIRGWAFDTVTGATIASVQFFIDGVLDTDVTCCSVRDDVLGAFPQFPPANTRNSGWGFTKNWGNETSGAHSVRVEIMSTSGEVFSATRTITVVKPGDFTFLDQFTLSGASAAIVGQQVQLTGVQIRDAASQATATVDTAHTWQPPSQQFELQSSAMMAQASPQRMWAFHTLWQALQELFTPASVVAQGMGLRTSWEGPVVGPVGGVDLVRGWGYDQAPAEELTTIRFFIDNVQNALVVCCSPRPDVAAAFPADVNALLSGWGLTLNWGNLTAGAHTAQIQFESSTGETVLSDTRTVTVIKLGGFTFLSELSLTGASVSLDGEEIVLSGVTVTESGTGTTATVTLRLRWDMGAQGLRLISATTTS